MGPPFRPALPIGQCDGSLQADAPHAGWTGDPWPLVVWTAIGLVVAVRRFSREATG